jgi:hypothetical protein
MWALPVFVASGVACGSTNGIIVSHAFKLAVDLYRMPRLVVHEKLDAVCDVTFLCVAIAHATCCGCSGSAASDRAHGHRYRDGLLHRVCRIHRVQVGIFWSAAALWKLNRTFLDPQRSCATVLALELVSEYGPSLPLPWVQVVAMVAPWLALIAEGTIALALTIPRAQTTGLWLALFFHGTMQCLPPPHLPLFFGLSMITARYFCFLPDELGSILPRRLAESKRAICSLHRPSLLGLGLGDMVARALVPVVAAGTGWAVMTLAALRFSVWNTPAGAPAGQGNGMDQLVLAGVWLWAPCALLLAQALLQRRRRRRLPTATSPGDRAAAAAAAGAPVLRRPGGRAEVALGGMLMGVYGILLPALGLSDLGTPNVFASLNIGEDGSNHLLVPASWQLGPTSHLVRVEHATSPRLRNHVINVSGDISPRARGLLHGSGHTAVVFREAYLDADYEDTPPGDGDSGVSPPDAHTSEPFVPYLLPAFELRRLLAEARTRDAEPFQLRYQHWARTAETTAVDETTAGHGAAAEVILYDWSGDESSCQVATRGTDRSRPCDSDELVHQAPPGLLLRKLLHFRARPDLPTGYVCTD